MAADQTSENKPIVIKKYANRRLYNTATSSYVTLEHLCQMVKDGKDFVVYDAKSGEDITRSVLTQIIFEEEGKGQNLLPINFLRQLIAFYGDSLQTLVPTYLDLSMSSFSKNQEQIREHVTEAFGSMNPFQSFEELGRQNMALFQRAVQMFNPFAAAPSGSAPAQPSSAAAKAAPKDANAETGAVAAASDDDINSLKSKLDQMQRQLDDLAKKAS